MTVPQSEWQQISGSPRKLKRRRDEVRCEVCRSKVWRHLIGKHLVSHYHCRKARFGQPQATALVLDNIHSVVRQAPFQCSPCKFYCNTAASFKQHWTSQEHEHTDSKVGQKVQNYWSRCQCGSDRTEVGCVTCVEFLIFHKHNLWRTPSRSECLQFQICFRLTSKLLISKMQ